MFVITPCSTQRSSVRGSHAVAELLPERTARADGQKTPRPGRRNEGRFLERALTHAVAGTAAALVVFHSFGAGDRIGCGWAAIGMPEIRNSPDVRYGSTNIRFSQNTANADIYRVLSRGGHRNRQC